MHSVNHDEFLVRLEREAQLQASLQQTQVLPKKLGALARIIALYPWQTMLILSGVTAVFLEILK